MATGPAGYGSGMTDAEPGAGMSTEDESDILGDATRTFLAARPQLFGIAYRVLGSATEAEDIVQEAWLRWQNTDRGAVREPAAFRPSLPATGRPDARWHGGNRAG